ncbi:hypothetical protein [Pontibacter liquoris]|uniref:hypothetical protein n=1 Tax=Pontibacter liquoris TaxID=2905677 RepID=UPI001FA7BDA1|nr:hypothetical protein [Pontibacter liquoris]
MSGKKTIAKQYWLTALVGVALLLLFSFQVKTVDGHPTAPVSKSAVAVAHAAEQGHSIWKVQVSDPREGLAPEWQQVLAVAVAFGLLLLFPLPVEKQAVLSLALPLASRNFCCIFPNGP